jgi:hypothetical protein
MVNAILFNDKRFNTVDDNNLLSPLTNNTIILCSNYKLMESLAEEIVHTINGMAEYNNYCCDEADVGTAKYILNFGLQKIIDVNGQRISLCLEPAMIYKAKNIEDIWFFDSVYKDETYKESIWPMTIFKGSHYVWDKGLDEVYRTIVCGIYGCYGGSWVDNPGID